MADLDYKDLDYKVLLEELLKLLSEGVYIVDADGIGVHYNQAMADIEKINVADVIGKEYSKAFPGVNPSDSTMFRALKKGEATSSQQQTYLNLYEKEITTINRTTPVKIDGKTVAAIEVASDITALRDMSDTIQALRGEPPVRTKTRSGLKKYTFDDLIGENAEFKAVVEKAKRAASNNASVFIYGETGTGKELFAQSIHYASARKDKPFIGQNCAALPQALLEGILFGTSKGGFTGAVDRAGLFEQASGGTLLLDEISAMPYEIQSKLLRVLQEDYIRRVGGTHDIPVDVRIIATVNEDPLMLIQEGKLRKDLYYRLNVVNLSIPPLRERKEDIPLLVSRFLSDNNRRFKKEIWMTSGDALRTLSGYDYPGNVRELENIIIQAVALASDEHVLTDDLLQMPILAEVSRRYIDAWNMNDSLPDYLDKLEKELLRETLLREGWNISKAADALGIKRQTLQHKMRKFGFKE
ncbi:MAG: sigma 54-interacting transcriptional regulator [Firmicutes bacterium]|nr:sigma 54-interacting transcriptional regulator [Bacillota bacterium]